MGVGTKLCELSIDAERGIFGIREGGVTEMYTTVHSGNVGSRTAFIKAGYEEVRPGAASPATALARPPLASRVAGGAGDGLCERARRPITKHLKTPLGAPSRRS
jgi:hypothetical protein